MSETSLENQGRGGLVEYILRGNQIQDDENQVAVEVVTPGATKSHLTYGQLKTLALQLASGLKKAGLQHGDRVILASPNALNYMPVLLAVIAAGGCFLGASTSRTTEEFQHWIDTAEPSFILVHHSIVDKFTATSNRNAPYFVLDESPEATDKTFQSVQGKAWPHWSALLDGQADLQAPLPQYTDEYLANTPILFTMTSGSTGKRKAAIQTHKSLTAAISLLLEAYPPPPTPHRFITLSTLEPGHIGQTGESLMALRLRHRLLITAIRDPATVLDLIRTYRVDGCFTSPLVLNHIAHEATRDDLASLKLTWTGGGTVPEAIMATVREKLPDGSDFYFGYGSTEAGIGCRRHVHDKNDHPAGYIDVGTFVPSVQVRVVDPTDGTIFSSSSTSDKDILTRSGVLQMRGASNFLGYWQRPDATAEAITEDGWVDTGDLVILDERTRHCWIVGRKKDVLKVGGSQVLPVDIEQCISQALPDTVEEVCVVGRPDEKYGEVPTAFIVPSRRNSTDANAAPSPAKSEDSKPSDLLIQSVHDVVNSQLGPLSKLAGGVHLVSELPRLGIGKFDKMLLKERAKNLPPGGGQGIVA